VARILEIALVLQRMVHQTCVVEMTYCCCVVDRHYSTPKDCCIYCMQAVSLYHHAESWPLCKSYYLFTLLFLSKQTRHGGNIVSFYSFLFICGRAKCLSCDKSSGPMVQLQAPEVLEWWPAALNEAGRSVNVPMNRPTITTAELDTFHL